MLGFQGGVSIPLVKGGVKAPPAKRQCRAAEGMARRGFTPVAVSALAATSAPASAKARTMPLPMPRPPPTTSTVCPVMANSGMLILLPLSRQRL